MKIVGIDPGTQVLGYSVIEYRRPGMELLVSRVLKVPAKLDLSGKLLHIWTEIGQWLNQDKPDQVAIEDIFVQYNIQSAFKIGQARGVIILAAAQQNIPIHEYSPREVKCAVTGNGNASKEQVAAMVRRHFPQIPAESPLDLTDAIGIAICHINRLH